MTPRIVFIARNVRATREMSVTALMNRFCEHGYDVTLICETGCNIKLDFRYDHRVKRLSFSMGVKNCATRAELLAHFIAPMPPSVFILSEFESEAYREFPAVIKAQSDAHRVICLPHFLFASALERGSMTYEQLLALAGAADVFVSNLLYSHVAHTGRLGGKSVWLPYFYPYGAGEYRAAAPGGTSILLLGSNAELIAATLTELAVYLKSAPGVTLKVAAGGGNEKTAEIYREYIEALGLSGRAVFDDTVRFDELAQGCAFAVVTSKFVYACDAYVQLAARRLPVLFASSYREPAFLSVDLARPGALAGQCAELMEDPSRAAYYPDLSEEASRRTFALWEALVADVAADRTPRGAPDLPRCESEEGILAHFDGILNAEKPERRPPSLKKRLRASRPANWIKRKLYYRERRRVQQYTPIQLSPEQVRKSQLLASKMLIEFERICKKHGLCYYVAAGSLLGAVRHGGPIPWDDDIDVTMPRPDYDKFLQIAQTELPEDMELPLSNYPYRFHRICMKGTRITRYIRQKGMYGIFLDILPLDGAAPTQRLKDKHWRRSQRLASIMLHSAWPQPPLTLSLKRVWVWSKRLLIKCFVPRGLLFWLWRHNAVKYSTETAGEWVCLPGIYGYEKECFPKEYWGEPVYLRYDGRDVPVMREWEQYLTAHYRDYMMPPPVLFRRTHMLFAIDFGKYETMGVEELEREVEAYGKQAGILDG